MDGFIKLERSLVDSIFYKDINAKVLYLHLRLLATYNGYKFGVYQLQAGQCVSSVRRLAKETGLTVKEVRCAIDRLIDYGEIETRERNRGRYGGTIFTLLNCYERDRVYKDTNNFYEKVKEALELDVYFDILNPAELMFWKKRFFELDEKLQEIIKTGQSSDTMKEIFINDLEKLHLQMERLVRKEKHFGFDVFK